MKITSLTEQDKKSIKSLFKEITSELQKNGIRQWDRFYPNRFVIGRDLKQRHLFGIKQNKKVIAVITVDGKKSGKYKAVAWEGDVEKAGCIHRLAVHPEYQGQGVGKMLLQYAEERARLQGFTSIRLDVFSENPSAVSMYRRLGYEERGEISFPFRKAPYLCFEKILL